MKWFNYNESKEWFALLGIELREGGGIALPESFSKLLSTMPSKTRNLDSFARSAPLWLSENSEKLLWITLGIDAPYFFEGLSRYVGETRPLSQIPGIFFEKFQSESDEFHEENRRLSECILFMMTFDWYGVIVSNKGDVLWIGDECISFHTPNPQKIQEAIELMDGLEMRRIEDIREAWA